MYLLKHRPVVLRGLRIPGPGAIGVAFGMLRAAPRCAVACQLTCTSETVTYPDADLGVFLLKTIYLAAVLARIPGIVRTPLKAADFYPKPAADKGLNENLQNRATTHNFVILETREDCNKNCAWPSPSACVRRLEPGL